MVEIEKSRHYFVQVLRIGSADETGENGYKLPEPGGPEGGPTMLHIFLYLSVVPLSVDCTN